MEDFALRPATHYIKAPAWIELGDEDVRGEPRENADGSVTLNYQGSKGLLITVEALGDGDVEVKGWIRNTPVCEEKTFCPTNDGIEAMINNVAKRTWCFKRKAHRPAGDWVAETVETAAELMGREAVEPIRPGEKVSETLFQKMGEK